MQWRLPAALILAAAGLWPQAARQPAQKPDEELPAPIQVDVELVNILCSVRDRRGGLVANLEKDDFTVVEDGKAQTVKYFSRESDLPLTIGLLVDVSVSQANLIDIERRAASQFFSQVLRKKDLAFLMSFGEEAELLQDYTNSAALLERGLDKLRVSSSPSGMHPGPVPTISRPRGTVLFDAVYLAAREQLKNQVGRKALVLITDGVDQGSRVRLEEAIEAAHRADAIVYSIYYYDPSAYYGHGGMTFGGVSDSDIKRMSEQTGGRLLKVSRKNTLEKVFEDIQQEMRSQYSIGYTSSNDRKDGGFRRLEVRTRNKDLKVQARKGYYAPKAGS
ncbi:MAG: VWA domain-containing protein [Bryobacterales bacterium]|nr:VWA domain-containing protein [Bryobacterales bacterium]